MAFLHETVQFRDHNYKAEPQYTRQKMLDKRRTLPPTMHSINIYHTLMYRYLIVLYVNINIFSKQKNIVTGYKQIKENKSYLQLTI